MPKKMLIFALEFCAGIVGNLVAGYIQQNIWNNLFTPFRLFAALVGIILMFIAITWWNERSGDGINLFVESEKSKKEVSNLDKLEVSPETLSEMIKIIPSDDFVLFCKVHFPSVEERFTRGMTRNEQTIYLLDECSRDPEQKNRFLSLFKDKYPSLYAKFLPKPPVHVLRVQQVILGLLWFGLVSVFIYFIMNSNSFLSKALSSIFVYPTPIEISALAPELGSIWITPTSNQQLLSSIDAVVDPVIAWNGLRVHDNPNGTRKAVLPADRRVTILSSTSQPAGGFDWVKIKDSVTGTTGWVKSRYLLMGIVENTYVNLYWVPGCNPQQANVALLRNGQQPCSANTKLLSLDDFADMLRSIGMIKAEEWLVASSPSGKLNEALLIRTRTNSQVGWLKIGTAFPLGSNPSLVGGVWRTPYHSNSLAAGTSVCWLRIDAGWVCENG